ncbi:hypothetical protein ACQKWADRAFT_224158 [Trichoderma austrokoningii]
MTSHEPSLLQARGGAHAHAHSAYKHRHAHGHGHDHLHHQYPHDAVSGPRPDADQSLELKRRAEVPAADEKSTDGTTPTATSLVTEVIQTVSLVQIVDTLGSPLSTLTQFAVPNTVVINKDTGKTISASNPNPTPAPAAPGSGPDLSKGVSSSPPSSSQGKATPLPSISASSPASLSSSALSSSPLAAPPPASSPASSPAPSPPPSLPPSMGIGHHNGTITYHSKSHSSAANSMFYAESVNASTTSTSLSSTRPTTHSPTSLTTTSSASSFSEPTSFTDAVVSTISSFAPQATDGGFAGGFGGGATPSIVDSMQPTPSASSNSTASALSPQQKQVIGGVLGGVAGAAFFLVLVLVVLRWKRRQNNAAAAAVQPTSESRGLPPTTGAPSGAPNGGGGSGGGSGSGSAMAERYSAAALTAAFTGLAPKRSSASVNSSETGERGFYRVSGRKLPSVLQVGGDGYSDPRSSFMSGTSDYYRGSQAFDPFGGPGTRLQLGAPMRPESGMPVIRSGPARPVVAEDNPFADPPTSPPVRPRAGPRRGSKFQEGI